jgi:hypothetical protein
VWTPKRVLLLIAGFGLFFTTYAVYAQILGGIDGLPLLPKEYWPTDQEVTPLDILNRERRANEAERKLILGFGSDCDELKRPIKLLLNTRGLVLASNVCEPQEDGRVLLKPFSIAIFGKDTGDGRYPEINTVRSAMALITFDRPIHNQTEIAGRKMIGGELRGSITLVNNRRTPQRTDDLIVHVSGLPSREAVLYYRERDHRIWTDGAVELTDTQSSPDPTTVNGVGMEVFLTPPAPATSSKDTKKTKGETVSGVDRIRLHRDVEMRIYQDARSGFLGNARDGRKANAEPVRARGATPKPAAPAAATAQAAPKGKATCPAKRELIVIKTEGPFDFDLRTNFATFDTPPRVTKQKGQPAYHVTVERIYKVTPAPPGQGPLYDQVICQRLELKFRRKTGSGPSVASETRSGEREIETAHATGEEVTILLDGPNGLVAVGNELSYQSATPTRGALTILKGKPLEVAKDGSLMRARELWIQSSLQPGGPTLTTARGPGQIDMVDRNVDHKVAPPRYPVHITWNDTLIATKDDGYDLYTLTGGASFIDDDHKQQLHGKKLQVWLVPADASHPAESAKTVAGTPKQATSAGPDPARQRPRRLEAFEHVRCYSPEMNVQEAEHLVVKFKDAPPAKGVLPTALPASPAAAADKKAPAGAEKKARGTAAAGKLTADGKTPAPGKEPAKPAKKPMDLWARSVIADVIRTGEKHQLDKMLSEGTVHVHQEGSTPQDKGVDITGEVLELYHDLRGDLLRVFGDRRAEARLQLNTLILKGPKVTIDQKDNTAEVKGPGTMTMPSNTTFDGRKNAKPGSMLTVYWNTGMFFNGKDAEFDGGATAKQDNSRLRCRTLQVSLDKYVSFKEGQKGTQGAKVEQMVCDKNVDAEEVVRENGKLMKYTQSLGREMTFDSRDERVYTTGPGTVKELQPGDMEDGLGTSPRPTPAQGGRTPPPKPKQEMKLTRIEYEGSMLTRKVGLDRRITTFREHVEAINVPCPTENVDMPVDKDRLPERGTYIRCEKMDIYTSPSPVTKGKNTQTLVAENRAYVKTPEYQAFAWRVIYEQATDLVKFEGKDGVPAVFYKLSPKSGGEPKQFRGQKILYNRKTRQFKVEDGDSIRLDD